jgi:DNA-binding response OmpR family regulator
MPAAYDRSACILVADSDAHARSRLAAALKDANCRVLVAADGEEALAKACEERPEVAFLDANLTGQGGWLVCAKLKLASSPPMVVMMVDRGAEKSVAGAGHPDRFAAFVQADEVLRKPFDAAAAVRLVQTRTASGVGFSPRAQTADVG